MFDKLFDFVKYLIFCYVYRILKVKRTFTLNSQQYNYLYHTHGSWKNERAVEVPICWKEIERNKGKRILEVGNVTSNYYKIQHEVLDKYERQSGVINEDVVNFKPDKKYDLILSISTLEHVGYDECKDFQLEEQNKILDAIKNLKQCLVNDGKLIVTMPLGYNPTLDEKILNEQLDFNEKYYLKRISESNKWIEIDKKDIENIKYNHPYPKANGLFVGFYNSKDDK